MTKEDKALVIQELTEKFKETSNFYFTDASGMTVEEVNNLRRKCFEAGIEYKVIKNTLIKKALENVEGDFSELNDTVLKGFTGVMFTSAEAANVPANVIKKFQKEDKDQRPHLKGASIDYDLFIGAEHLSALSKLKSKNELIGEVIGLLQSPAKNVISSLQSGGQTLSGLLKTLSER
ncbi:50S ribosomal protein L10 [Reichenbachiella versicolor]|uniref:50S ribosomal protein L10 n=1 Tax=Reichenbachiella versicolor TaxID=1821036 RepID=UPI000D6E56A9|nr:50S ribosomal protein L10 [Reichenbachiella versicolor]